jgi:hypothetical protein
LLLPQGEEKEMTTTDYLTVPVHYSVTPDSSFIEFVGYNNDMREAYVVIHDVTYVYGGVDYADYSRLVNAESVGHEYSKWFRPTFGPGGVEYGVVYFEQAQGEAPVEASAWDQLLLTEDEMSALVTEVARETAKDADVYTENAINTDWAEASLRRDAMGFAAQIFQGTGQRDEVLDAAIEIEEYLRG